MLIGRQGIFGESSVIRRRRGAICGIRLSRAGGILAIACSAPANRQRGWYLTNYIAGPGQADDIPFMRQPSNAGSERLIAQAAPDTERLHGFEYIVHSYNLRALFHRFQSERDAPPETFV